VASGEIAAGALTGKLSDSFCSTDSTVARVFAQTTFFSDNRVDLPLVSRPCLILQHREDALAPLGVGEYMHAKLQVSTLKVLDVVGHCGHMSQLFLVAEAVRNYFNNPSSS